MQVPRFGAPPKLPGKGETERMPVGCRNRDPRFPEPGPNRSRSEADTESGRPSVLRGSVALRITISCLHRSGPVMRGGRVSPAVLVPDPPQTACCTCTMVRLPTCRQSHHCTEGQLLDSSAKRVQCPVCLYRQTLPCTRFARCHRE